MRRVLLRQPVSRQPRPDVRRLVVVSLGVSLKSIQPRYQIPGQEVETIVSSALNLELVKWKSAQSTR